MSSSLAVSFFKSRNKGFKEIIGPTIKGLVHPEMKILSVFTHPHVAPTFVHLRNTN